MPGSYPDPRSYAVAALELLEEAYEGSPDTHTGSLILKAIETITRLKEEMRNSAAWEYDPYEVDESNSAV